MGHKRRFPSKSVLACLVALLVLAAASAGAGAVTWITPHLIGGSQVEELHGAVDIPGGGYVAVGSTMSTDHDMDVPGFTLMDGVIVWISPTGAILGVTKAGGNANDNFNAVTRTTDGGFVAVGYSYSTTGDMAGQAKVDRSILKSYLGHSHGDVLGAHYQRFTMSQLAEVPQKIGKILASFIATHPLNTANK